MAGAQTKDPISEKAAATTEAAPGLFGGGRIGVLLPLPLGGPAGGVYDYRCSPDLTLQPGDFVEVPLGRRNLIGVVWNDGAGDIAAARLKDVIARIDLPPFPEISRRFIDWVAGYSMAAPGAVLRMAMSVPDAFEPPRSVKAWRAVSMTGSEQKKLSPQRRRVLDVLQDQSLLQSTELARQAAVSPGVIRQMAESGLIEAVAMPLTPPYGQPDATRPGPVLSPEQRHAADMLSAMLRNGGYGAMLLDGVTGSGKTEVYFEAIATCLAQGKQALVLLPEIALGAQWLQRFEKRFGALPAQWHSELTGLERRLTWRAVLQGDAKVVVGARSALFLPYHDLGLIIVDEEHEAAFKQEEGVIYQARDMAVVRAHLGQIPVVLASATPSLESLVNVESGKYQALQLPDRHGGAQLPSMHLIDLRRDQPVRGSWLSPTLLTALDQALAAGEQALLFLNRRGYAPLTLCRDCGHRLQCPHCTAWLVEHRFHQRLQCHHCGFTTQMPSSCTKCGSTGGFTACGPGVERLAEEAALRFPDARRLILTSDTVTGPAKAAALMRSIQEHEIDLIIGTQIIAKGHHFPNLTLVGVVDADLGLNGGDLRAAERTFQLLHQVAGRAGRGSKPGQVFLQTYDPDRPVMQALMRHDRAGFLEVEAADRDMAGMPPFGRLAAVIIAGSSEAAVDELARALARSMPRIDGVTILGPAPAPLAVLRGRHRRRFLVKCRRDVAPQTVLRRWLEGRGRKGDPAIQVDIDPYSFL
ncbi:MAG: primosomal protein N' [Dongiaceae bacterium]